MCGIAVTFSPYGVTPRLDLGEIGHRGPDSCGEWISPDERHWMGHTRLAILDLSANGAQPMTSVDGSCTIVFNGEIYNHLEIRAGLLHVNWRGNSDTETLVEAWSRMGVGVLEELRGMFAFAVHDARDGSVTIVRDRFGIKPVYYRWNGHCLAAASEVRVLNGGRRPNLSPAALASYLATGHLPTDGPVGDGIEILPPAHWLRIDRHGNLQRRCWWPDPKGIVRFGPRSCSLDDARHAVRQRVEDAVAEHLLADVPVASFLSGGIDSSIISLVAARYHSEPLRTFSVGFPQAAYDERSVARLVADRAGARHTEIEVSAADCLDWVMDAVCAMDLPSADAVNTFIVSKAVRREGLKVAISGLGGDELFGGYPSFRDVPRLAWLRYLPEQLARRGLQLLPEVIGSKLLGMERFDSFSLALVRRRWWSSDKLREAGVTVPAHWPELNSSPVDDFAAVSWAELLGYMEPMLLRDSDQMSMSMGLELRVPFLDHRLVELTLALPAEFKRGNPPKRLLIEAFQDELPPEVWQRPKKGFALPMDEWMRGPLRDFCREGLALATKVLAHSFVQFTSECFENRRLHWTRLWQIVVLGHYVKRVVHQ